MGYNCDRCNLEFSDFEHYLDHECKSYDATQMTYIEARTLENLFHRFKNGTKAHISNSPITEEKKKFLMSDLALEVESLDFESNDYSANQLCYETLNERAKSLSSIDDLESYLQSQFDANQTNPQANCNQLFLYTGQRQMKEINAQINTNPLLVSHELIPKQYFKCATNQYPNTNQDSLAAEYGQMQHNMRQMNPE
ncbi:hypothetical protein TNIN_312821 [Trichonephila inaurata madagascariensis]|uniref:Uncharacterized protein n=1 Tax=Trichonephila inaurata madagascariensis TaxID=2747483 RepID=A0A8X7CPF3_9ARAC|nr:hypothetical protein TNIN_312821 [Trichonephila inaurata madagascariensis]